MTPPTTTDTQQMVKMGLPKENVKLKMTQEGMNAAYLDKDPQELVPLSETKGEPAKKESVAKKPAVRKKKLHWKALDASKVGSDSLWADKDDDITLDEAEFNKVGLFNDVILICILISADDN